MIWTPLALPPDRYFRNCKKSAHPECSSRHHIPYKSTCSASTRGPLAPAGFLTYFREHMLASRFASRDRGCLPLVVPRGSQRDILFTAMPTVPCFLMPSTGGVPRGRNMETVDTRQRRPVHRCNFSPSPDCVGMDVGRRSDHSHQVQPPSEQDQSRESVFDPPS